MGSWSQWKQVGVAQDRFGVEIDFSKTLLGVSDLFELTSALFKVIVRIG